MHDRSYDSSFKNDDNENVSTPPPLEDTDLYSVLNIPLLATQEEIQISYRRFSRIFHPDKHSINADSHRAAQRHFSKVKEAYDILSDVRKRLCYDEYGMRGLKVLCSGEVALGDSWGRKEELEVLYERRRRKEGEERLRRETRPDCGLTVGVNCTDIFDRYLKEDSSEHYLNPSIYVHMAELRQSVCLGVTNNDTVNLIGTCSTLNGLGKGELVASWRRLLYPKFQDTWIDIQTSVNTDSDVSGAVILSRKILDKVTMRLGGTFVMPRFGSVAPGVVSSFNWQISDSLFGEVEYKWNLDSKLHSRLGWHSHNGNHGVNIGVKISTHDTHLTLYYNYILSWRAFLSQKSKQSNNNNDADDEWSIDEKNEPIKLKIGGRYGLRSVYGEVGISRRITKFSTFGISLSIGVPLGILVKFKIIRGNQTFVFPLLMSEELNPAASFYGSIVPMAVFLAVKNLLYDPWKKKEMEIEISKRRQYCQSELKRQRDEAYSAQNLMTETARRISQQEKDKNGLIIERAIYGKLTSVVRSSNCNDRSPTTTNLNNEDPVTQETVDVTTPLQVMVERSRLHLAPCRPGFTRGQLQGFYDPCLGLISTIGSSSKSNDVNIGGVNFSSTRRQLYVKYRFLNVLHEVVVGDQEELAVPMESHQIN